MKNPSLLVLLSLYTTLHCEEAKVNQNATDLGKNIRQNQDIKLNKSSKFRSEDISSLSLEKTPLNDSSETSSESEEVKWDAYTDLLIAISLEQLYNVQDNIKKYYNLRQKDIQAIEKVFNETDSEYEYLLQYNIKLLVDKKKFNKSEEFMIDFMDMSNIVIEKIIDFNLDKVKGALIKPTSWKKQNLKDKIFRQQVKASTAVVELVLCSVLTICKEREKFFDYVVEWLRYILSLKNDKLSEFYNALPGILSKYNHFVKTSPQFRKNLQYVIRNYSAQRDTADFIDEVITNPEAVILIPNVLKKCADLLIDITNILDETYKMTEENLDDLERVSQMLLHWNRNDSVFVKQIWDIIFKNMNSNFKTWPHDKQKKLTSIWAELMYL